MRYDPFTIVKHIFNKVEDPLRYCDMANCPYYHPQEILKAYNIINSTVKLQQSIKYWNRLSLIQKTWISFKTHFCEAHL